MNVERVKEVVVDRDARISLLKSTDQFDHALRVGGAIYDQRLFAVAFGDEGDEFRRNRESGREGQ